MGSVGAPRLGTFRAFGSLGSLTCGIAWVSLVVREVRALRYDFELAAQIHGSLGINGASVLADSGPQHLRTPIAYYQSLYITSNASPFSLLLSSSKPTTPTTMAANTHTTISPAIFYWGTPVVLISTTNLDGTTNIAPMSSAWWLGNRCMLGLGRVSQTVINLTRTRECVLNLPSADLAPAVNRLARTTGNREAMAAQRGMYGGFKRANGYEYVADKFARAGLTAVASEVVAPSRVGECAAQMECELVGVYEFMPGAEAGLGVVALDVRVLKTHVSEGIRMEGFANRVDPEVAAVDYVFSGAVWDGGEGWRGECFGKD